LRELISNLSVENTFIILGKKSNPFPYMKKCKYFLLASYYEGLPTVLTEAKILNKYIFATDTAGAEALDDYINKTIVNNNELAIYEGMKSLITNALSSNSNYIYTNEDILDKIINLLGE